MKKVNSDVAYTFIRQKIISGEFPPGYPLMTEALSELTKVSRTPVREALHRLKAEGLVSIRPHLGASVKKMHYREFREMCEMRLALEGHAAGLAAVNHSASELREIKVALEKMRELTEKILRATEEAPFLDDLVHQDVRFHIAIMTAAKNELMKQEILRLHLVNRVVGSTPSRLSSSAGKQESDKNRKKVLASHEEIAAAIERSDAIGAKLAMESHIQDIIDKSLRAFQADAQQTRELSDEELVYSS